MVSSEWAAIQQSASSLHELEAFLNPFRHEYTKQKNLFPSLVNRMTGAKGQRRAQCERITDSQYGQQPHSTPPPENTGRPRSTVGQIQPSTLYTDPTGNRAAGHAHRARVGPVGNSPSAHDVSPALPRDQDPARCRPPRPPLGVYRNKTPSSGGRSSSSRSVSL